MLLFKLLHVMSMLGVVTLWVGAWVVWDLVARSGDRDSVRRVHRVSQVTGQIGFLFLIVGVLAGFATALTGGFNLTAGWLLIAYALLLSDLLTLRLFGINVERVRQATRDETADLQRVASSRLANATLEAVVGFWALLVADMVVKPFS
jgi:uncharacterized membrane protein